MFFSVFLFIKEPAEYHPELQIYYSELVSGSNNKFLSHFNIILRKNETNVIISI